MAGSSARRGSRARPAQDWRKLGAIAGAAVASLLLAAAVLSDGVANLTEAADPGTALAWKPLHARAQEMAATSLVESDPAAAAALARQAYGRDPTRAGALRVLGVARGLRGDEQGAAVLLRDAERLTRRDLPTELFFIESAVSRGDVQGALAHFDVAMRTSRSARALLVPILCNALQDQRLIRPIARMIDAVPDWTGEFVNGCADQAAPRPALARALTIAGRARRAAPPVVTAKTAQLVALGGDVGGGRALYEALLHDAGRAVPRTVSDPRFGVATAIAPFDWTYATSPVLGAEQGGAGASGLDVHARNRSGAVAWQMLVLAPGRYRLGISGASAKASPGARITARLACAMGDQAELGVLPLAATARFAGETMVTVPAGCTAQWLRLFIEGTDGSSYDGRIDAVALDTLTDA